MVVLREGQILERPSREQRLSDTDLRAAARQQGIRSLDEVDLAVLEADGRISFFTSGTAASGAPETGSGT